MCGAAVNLGEGGGGEGGGEGGDPLEGDGDPYAGCQSSCHLLKL